MVSAVKQKLWQAVDVGRTWNNKCLGSINWTPLTGHHDVKVHERSEKRWTHRSRFQLANLGRMISNCVFLFWLIAHKRTDDFSHENKSFTLRLLSVFCWRQFGGHLLRVYIFPWTTRNMAGNWNLKSQIFNRKYICSPPKIPAAEPCVHPAVPSASLFLWH